MSWVGTLMPLLEPPDPQHIGDTMINENEKIKQLEARIKELEIKCEELQADLVGIDEDIAIPYNMARAICELQEEFVKQFPTTYMVNIINAPTKVGMN